MVADPNAADDEAAAHVDRRGLREHLRAHRDIHTSTGASPWIRLGEDSVIASGYMVSTAAVISYFTLVFTV